MVNEEKELSMDISRAELVDLIAYYEVLLDDLLDNFLDNYKLQPDNHSSKALKEFRNFLSSKAFKEFLAKYPDIPNYDSKGNWDGPVSNENGWTP